MLLSLPVRSEKRLWLCFRRVVCDFWGKSPQKKGPTHSFHFAMEKLLIRRASPPPTSFDPPSRALFLLNKELLTLRQWNKIRDEFAARFEEEFMGDIKEPKKFRRHCKEQLGKWVLSQKCRESIDSPPTFFPTALITYDKQLVRDLSLKCSINKAVIDRIEAFVRKFELGTRCAAAFSFVTVALQDPSILPEKYTPVIGLSIEAAERAGRIEGEAIQLWLKWDGGQEPSWFTPFVNCSVPTNVWSKLEHCFKRLNPEAPANEFPVRAATLIIRYEHVLCSGSLQLCADSAQKNRLSADGYYVMDLCASPINAYMGPPLPDVVGPFTVRPFRRFCSAFPDTDAVFGSVGSAMHFDGVQFSQGPDCGGHPCVFTLDVPYDEDMCELMLTKLHKDATAVSMMPEIAARLSWMLTLPLWWNLDFVYIPRALATHRECTPQQLTEVHKALESHLKRCAAYQQEGFVLSFSWTEQFQQTPLVCFNAIFVKEAYTYFDAALNKALPGITETQVIALQHPSFSDFVPGIPSIRKVLHDFYPYLCVF